MQNSSLKLNNENTEILKFFENSSTFSLIKLLIPYGIWKACLFFILFIVVFLRIASLFANIADVIKDDKEIKDMSEGKGLKQIIQFNELHILENIKIFCKSFIKFSAKAEFHGLSSLDKIVQLMIVILVLSCWLLVYILFIKILLSGTMMSFREDFFASFLNKLDITNFSNPQKCINYLNAIFCNIESLFENIFNLIHYIIVFIYYFYQCLKMKEAQYKRWRMWLLIWMTTQIVCSLLLFIVNKNKTDTELQIAIIENGYISNSELQKLFSMFENNRDEYVKLLEKRYKESVFRESLNFTIATFAGISTFLTIGYGMIFEVYKIGGIIGMVPLLQSLFSNFTKIPEKTSALLKVISALEGVYYKFKCNKQSGEYLCFSKNEIKKRILDSRPQKSSNTPISIQEMQKYLKLYFPGMKCFKRKNKFYIEKIKISEIHSIYIDGKYVHEGGGKELNIKLNIEKNPNKPMVIFILGAAGSGKTTLINVILGLFKLQGVVKFNNIPIDFINLSALYQSTAIALQFTKFIRASLEDYLKSVISKNNKFAGEEYNKREQIVENPYSLTPFCDYIIDQAINISGLDKFISAWPLGKKTIIREDNVSGGTKGVIALTRELSRIYYAEALQLPIYLAFFDEIVASLDHLNARRVLRIIFQTIIKMNMLAFFIDHSGLVWELLKNSEIKKSIDIRIIFMTRTGIKYGTIEELSNNDNDFLDMIKQQENP